MVKTICKVVLRFDLPEVLGSLNLGYVVYPSVELTSLSMPAVYGSGLFGNMRIEGQTAHMRFRQLMSCMEQKKTHVLFRRKA